MKFVLLVSLAVLTVDCHKLLHHDPEIEISGDEALFNHGETDDHLLSADDESLDEELYKYDDHLELPPENMTMHFIRKKRGLKRSTNEDIAYPDSWWPGSQCDWIGDNLPTESLETCRSRCYNNKECNAYEYIPGTPPHCTARLCPEPVPEPSEVATDGTTAYVLKRASKPPICKPKRFCRDLGGSCVARKEDCKGKFVDKGCRGENCHCCLPGCPDGFFRLPDPANQCLKFLDYEPGNWTQAQQRCWDQGLELAKPLAPVLLREYMTLKYGNRHFAWLQATGNGSNFVWADGQILESDNPMWSSTPDVSVGQCLVLLNSDHYWNEQPERPYLSTKCSNQIVNPLCEKVVM